MIRLRMLSEEARGKKAPLGFNNLTFKQETNYNNNRSGVGAPHFVPEPRHSSTRRLSTRPRSQGVSLPPPPPFHTLCPRLLPLFFPSSFPLPCLSCIGAKSTPFLFPIALFLPHPLFKTRGGGVGLYILLPVRYLPYFFSLPQKRPRRQNRAPSRGEGASCERAPTGPKVQREESCPAVVKKMQKSVRFGMGGGAKGAFLARRSRCE